MSCGVSCRRGLDPAWLWLWCRLVATALIRPLAWEPPYALGAAVKRPNNNNNNEYKLDIDYKCMLYYFPIISYFPLFLRDKLSTSSYFKKI